MIVSDLLEVRGSPICTISRRLTRTVLNKDDDCITKADGISAGIRGNLAIHVNDRKQRSLFSLHYLGIFP